MKLSGKIAVLTGGKRIGVTVAKDLAKKGVNFVLTYRTSRKIAEETAENLRKNRVSAFVFRADLSKETDVKKLFKFVLKKFGGVDFLIHMASTFVETPFEILNEKIWNREIGNNLTSAFLCSKFAADIMLKQKSGGKIILIGDAAVDSPYKGKMPYLTAKAGLHALTKILAVELAPKISVNCVAPGKVLPQKTGTPEDVAKAILFFLENDDGTTGQFRS